MVDGNRVYDTPARPVIVGDPPLLCTCESIEDAHLVARCLDSLPFSDRILDLVGRVGEARKEWDEADAKASEAKGAEKRVLQSDLMSDYVARASARIVYECAEELALNACRAHRIAEDALLAAFREGEV